MNGSEPRESPTVDDLLDRWRVLSEQGVEPTLEEITEDASEQVRVELARRLADIQAARDALKGLWDVTDEDVIPFCPHGAPGRYVDPKRLDEGGMGVLCIAYDAELKPRWLTR